MINIAKPINGIKNLGLVPQKRFKLPVLGINSIEDYPDFISIEGRAVWNTCRNLL